jgi:hypothetical protein
MWSASLLSNTANQLSGSQTIIVDVLVMRQSSNAFNAPT